MKFQSLQITKLFGTFDYEMNFSDTEAPFIITGSNGFGKTTILNILHHIAKRDFVYFYPLRFENINLVFDNQAQFSIYSTINLRDNNQLNTVNNDVKRVNDHFITFTYTINDRSTSFTLDSLQLLSITDQIEKTWAEDYQHHELLSEEFYQYITSHKDEFDIILKKKIKDADIIYLYLEQFNVLFVESQRLFIPQKNTATSSRRTRFYMFEDSEEQKQIEKVIEISSSLSNKIQDVIDLYLRSSNKIDARLIETIYDLNPDQTLSESEYEDKANELFTKINRLQKYGLLDSIPKRYPYNIEHKDAATAFINALEEKLQVYDSMLEKIELFDSLLTQLKFINKHIVYTKTKGLQILNQSGLELSLKQLSTGEQNEIIMLYRMIFEINEDSIMLLDEPENSLHIAWQNDYLTQIEQIAKIKKMQVIVATHSPHIIAGRWTDCYDLTKEWYDRKQLQQ